MLEWVAGMFEESWYPGESVNDLPFPPFSPRGITCGDKIVLNQHIIARLWRVLHGSEDFCLVRQSTK